MADLKLDNANLNTENNSTALSFTFEEQVIIFLTNYKEYVFFCS